MASRPRTRCSAAPGRSGCGASSGRSVRARRGRRDAGRARSLVELPPARGHVLLQLLLDAVVEPWVLPALEQPLPLLRRDLGRLGRPLLLPGRVRLRAEERAHEDPVLVVLQRVGGGEEDGTGAFLADRLERQLLAAHVE